MFFVRSIAFLFLGFATAFGQVPAETAPAIPPNETAPPGVPIPGVPPPPPAGAPATPPPPAPQPSIPLAQTKITADINEPKLSGNALAGLYHTYTGHRVIVSAAAAIAEFSFVQEASPQDPLTFAQAAELLKKAATIENFVFVPDGQDPNLDILTFAAGGLRPTARGVPVYNENDVLPTGDAVISYVMSLKFIKPAEAVNTFTQVIGQFGAYGSIAPVANASAVVITENTSLIRKLIDLKKEIDKPGSVQGSRFIEVRYADVTEIAETLTTLLTAQQATQKTAGIQRAAAPVPAGAAGAGQAAASNGSGEETPVQIIPDPRTNRIFVMGRPLDLIFVEGLVHEFDVKTSDENFMRRKLRFLTVSDFLPIASDALTRAFGGGGSSGGSNAQAGAAAANKNGANNGGSNQASTRQGSSRSSSRNGSSGANFGGSSGSSSSGASGSSAGLGDPQVSSAPESALVGRTLLVADNITNSIVVQGPPSGLEIIKRLLDQIDVKPDQVMISTVIGQLTVNDSKEFGVNYLLNSSKFSFGGGGSNGGTTANNTTGTNLTTTVLPRFDPATITGSGLRALGTVGDLSIYLKALQSRTDFTVLSRPSIFTSNNQKGTISSGEKIAIPTQGGTSGGNYNSGTSIQYQDVVLKLEVIPLVNSDNEITMKIALLNDEQNGTQIIAGAGTNGGNLTVPKISTREILTTATVPNGQTIVLGGLIVGRNGQEKSGIPILSDIPLLGKLFSTTADSKDRSELMVFIQPSVVKGDRTLDAVQTDMDSRYKVSGKVREMADGPGNLPPLDANPPLADKGGAAKPAAPRQTPPSSPVKPIIRSSFRR